MSKNFELMQQAELDREHLPFSDLTTLYRRSDGNSSRKLKRSDFNLNRLYGEESLRLVQHLFLQHAAKSCLVVVFAGIDHGAGCSHVIGQAAETLARNVQGSVCVVDANFRSPSLPEFFGVSKHTGLLDSLAHEGPLLGFAEELGPSNLWLLSCGMLAPDSPRLLNSTRFKLRIAELRENFDYVLIDSPPLSRYGDALSLGQVSDGLVLVLEANATRKESARKAVEILRAVPIAVIGAVLNKRTFPIPQSVYRRL